MAEESSPGRVRAAAKGLKDAEIILGALAGAAVANLVVVLVAGGYELDFLGVSVSSRSPLRPLLIVLAILAVRWLVSSKREGIIASLRSFLPWGAVSAVAGSGVLLAVVHAAPPVVPGWFAVVVWAVVQLAFFFGWAAWGRPSPSAARLVVVILYLAMSAGLADSLGDREVWGRTFDLPRGEVVETMEVPADREGLLSGGGTGVSFRKIAVGNDWRNAAVVSSGGFFSAKAAIGEGDTLRFSVASTRRPRSCRAVVTAVSVGGKNVLWEEDSSSLGEKSWRDVSIPLSPEGEADIVFEVAGPEGEGTVLFANPRIETRRENRLNFILLVVDALRADRLGLYGYGSDTSAEIDGLAADAVVFEDYIVQASFTPPSMTSIFTSLYPAVHGVFTTRRGLAKGLETLAQRFLRDGYSVGAVQVNALLRPDRRFARGFGEYFHFPPLELNDDNKDPYVSAEVVNRKALEWLDRHSGGPFFLYLHYMDVHDPYEPPEEFRRFGTRPSDLYDGGIAYFSRQFGEFHRRIGQKGLLANTVIVLTADHGEQFLEHGFTGHHKGLYFEETRVPLVFWVPGREGQRRISARVSGLDLAPTLLELASLEPLSHAAGRSLTGAFKGERVEGAAVFSELLKRRQTEYIVALSRGNYRFMESNPGAGKFARVELYDLEKDPRETSNIAARNEEVVAEMRREVEDFIAAQAKLRAKLVKEDFRVRLSKEDVAQLRTLGYLGTGAPRAEPDR